MKQFVFAVAVVALVASVGVAEDKPATKPTTPATPAVVTSTPVVEYAPATTQRRGLFSRLRNRNTQSYSTAPVTLAPGTVTPTPSSTPPKAMPSTKPNTDGTSATKAGTIVLTSGTMVDGAVMTAGYSEPTMQRRGLMSRLRNR